MTKEQEGYDYSEHEKDRQNSLIDCAGNQPVDEQRQEQRRFRSNNVDVDRADEIPLLALEDQIAIIAFSAHSEERYVERP